VSALAATGLLAACSGPATRQITAADDGAARASLASLSPPAGFVSEICPTEPAVCFRSASLLQPMTTTRVAQLLTSFGVKVNHGGVGCSAIPDVSDPSKVVSLDCEAFGTVGRFGLTITVSSSKRPPSADQRTAVYFTAVRVHK
jgi:hypothetical protein